MCGSKIETNEEQKKMDLERVRVYHDVGEEIWYVNTPTDSKSGRRPIFFSPDDTKSMYVADRINNYITMVENGDCDISPVKLYVLSELTPNGCENFLTYIINQEANMSDDIFECVARIREFDYAKWVVGAINEYISRVQNPTIEEKCEDETEDENPEVQYWKNKCKEIQDKLDDANKHAYR